MLMRRFITRIASSETVFSCEKFEGPKPIPAGKIYSDLFIQGWVFYLFFCQWQPKLQTVLAPYRKLNIHKKNLKTINGFPSTTNELILQFMSFQLTGSLHRNLLLYIFFVWSDADMCEIYLTFRVLEEYLRLPTSFFFLIKLFLFNPFFSSGILWNTTQIWSINDRRKTKEFGGFAAIEPCLRQQ